MSKLRAVLYARVSTDKEDQINSIENQITSYDEICREYGYEKVDDVGVICKKDGTRTFIPGIYADEGISGTSMRKREALKQMIKDAKNRKFDLIVTKSVSRFGRNVEDVSKTVKDLKELGIGVFFLDLKVNSLDNSKEFMINLFASLAQEESNMKSYLVQFGIRKAQKLGKWTTGTPPYGYDNVDSYLQVNPKEAEIVKEIFNLYYYEGYGTSKIARYLNSKGIKTKKGKNGLKCKL